MNTHNPIITGILIGLFGASLGFGGSQMFVVGRVATEEFRQVDLRNDFEGEKKRTDDRILKLADLVGAAIGQNKEFISLIREQNSLFKQQLESNRK